MSASVRRVFVFAFVFALVTWLLMAFTKNAGASTHHTILLWPAPPLLLAAGLVTFRRWPRGSILAAALAVLICISNIFVSTTYFSHQIRNGGAVAWSDSLYSLSAMLSSERPDEVCLLDWGFFDNLRLLQKGTLKLCTLAAPTTEDEHIALRSKLSQKKVFFISHTEGNEFFPEAAKRFTSALQSAGYGVRILRTIADRNGRPTINVFTVTLPVQ